MNTFSACVNATSSSLLYQYTKFVARLRIEKYGAYYSVA